MRNTLIKLKIEFALSSIINNKHSIMACLQSTETYKTAKTEYDKSVLCLRNIDKQIEFLQKGNFSDLCVFLPMNQPLYSTVLFAIVPSCMFERVICRPPVLLNNVYASLFSILQLSDCNILCECSSRKDFIRQRVSVAHAVIYTGQYENALEVMKSISPETIFIFQGSGTNPIIITETASIDNEVINKVIGAQTYNSGQDCMAPSAILVSDNKWSEFIKKLTDTLPALNIGNYGDIQTDIAPMLEQVNVASIKRLFDENLELLLYGGQVDLERKIVYPTIIEFKTVNKLPYCSSFSPTFCLYRYQHESDVLKYLERPECQENKAYLSIFGEMESILCGEIVINNDVLDSIDNGYSEFGGFGIRSGFISYGNTITAKPILISRELAMYRNVNDTITAIGDLESPIYETSIVLSNVRLSQKSVLEVGCGTIPHARLLAPYCEHYVAIDTNQDKVDEATANNELDNLTIKVMNGTELMFESETFEAVLMFHCLHEAPIEEQGSILKEIHRVLKEKGLLIVLDATSEYESAFQQYFDIIHEQFFDYKHIFAVKHSEWIISEYVRRGFFHELKKETFKMFFSFSSFEELRDCLLRSFAHEYKWSKGTKKKFTKLIKEKHLASSNRLQLDEVVKLYVLEKEAIEIGPNKLWQSRS